MERPGCALLPHPRLAQQQHRQLGGRDALEQPTQPLLRGIRVCDAIKDALVFDPSVILFNKSYINGADARTTPR